MTKNKQNNKIIIYEGDNGQPNVSEHIKRIFEEGELDSIKSSVATHFRRWATARLREYMVKGFTMDDERIKGTGGGQYWGELLDRIRDIRSSEKAKTLSLV